MLPLLIGLIPTLVNAAETIFPKSESSSKKQFVVSALGLIWDALGDKIPAGLQSCKDAIISELDALIEAAVAKL